MNSASIFRRFQKLANAPRAHMTLTEQIIEEERMRKKAKTTFASSHILTRLISVFVVNLNNC